MMSYTQLFGLAVVALLAVAEPVAKPNWCPMWPGC